MQIKARAIIHPSSDAVTLRCSKVLCQICDQLRLSVPGLCLGVPGKGSVPLH
jgi:hypothetical protein